MRVFLGICLCIILAGGIVIVVDDGDGAGTASPRSDSSSQTAAEVDETLVQESRTLPEESMPPMPVVPLEPAPVPNPEPEPEPEPESEPEPTEAKTPKRSIDERIDDRSIRLGGKYILRGNGTERDPYTISWELLASARSTIDAAKGELDPPAHIELLDGAWVRLDGYYSSPLLEETVDEVLLTLNRWDGCCIGLPPTPFDCIETGLRKPINMRSRHLVRFGTVTGRMKVRPFAIGNWLMGLYQLEDATLDMGST